MQIRLFGALLLSLALLPNSFAKPMALIINESQELDDLQITFYQYRWLVIGIFSKSNDWWEVKHSFKENVQGLKQESLIIQRYGMTSVFKP